MQSLSWDNYRYILAVHRCETLSGAARLLGVNETTVSRRLAQSEAFLQARLFSRRSTGWVATDCGQRLIARLERVKGEIDEAVAEVSNSQTRVAGSIRIACESILMHRMLVPNLNALLDDHPELVCELVSITPGEPLRDADIAVHFASLGSTLGADGRSAKSGVVHLLGQLELGVFKSANMSVPGAPWITQAGTLHQRPFWADEPATGTSPEDATLRRVLVDSAETLLCCVRSGLGQCRLPMGVGMREPLLVRVETGHPEWLQDLEQVSQPELAGSPRLAACSAWLKDCLDRFNRY